MAVTAAETLRLGGVALFSRLIDRPQVRREQMRRVDSRPKFAEMPPPLSQGARRVILKQVVRDFVITKINDSVDQVPIQFSNWLLLFTPCKNLIDLSA